jgi:hypothetical protein
MRIIIARIQANGASFRIAPRLRALLFLAVIILHGRFTFAPSLSASSGSVYLPDPESAFSSRSWRYWRATFFGSQQCMSVNPNHLTQKMTLLAGVPVAQYRRGGGGTRSDPPLAITKKRNEPANYLNPNERRAPAIRLKGSASFFQCSAERLSTGQLPAGKRTPGRRT